MSVIRSKQFNWDANLSAGNFDLTNLRTVWFNGEITTGGSTVDWTLGQKHSRTITANTTWAFTAPGGIAGGFRLAWTVGGAGGWTITWPASVRFVASEPTWGTTTNDLNVAWFEYNGTIYAGSGGLLITP